MILRVARPVAATLLIAAAWAALPTGSAHAASACSGTIGVTVVTDFNGLGGGVQGKCIADGGGDKASELFPAAKFQLTYASRQPGYVCRVSGVPLPKDDACVNTSPASAYWGLWWSDGKSGTWTYSSLGVGSLRIPDGGYVAFAWDDVDGSELPSYTPAPRPVAPSAPPSSAPDPTSQPTSQPSAQPTEQPTAPSGQPTRQPGSTTPPSAAPSAPAPGAPSSPSATQPGSATPSPTPTGTPTATPSATPTPTPTDPEAPTPGATPSDAVDELADPVAPTSADADDDGGLPGWLAPLVIVLLFGLAGGFLVLKRRQAAP